jgi:signal transduction histidine kinase
MNTSIICIDDQKGIRDAFQEILGREPDFFDDILDKKDETTPFNTNIKYNLFFADSGEKAVEIVKKELANNNQMAVGFFDMRLSDGMDGYQTIKTIREIDPDILCVVITAYTDRNLEQIRDLFTENSQDELLYLKKPFSAEELSQTALNTVYSWNRKRDNEEKARIIQENREDLEHMLQEVQSLLKKTEINSITREHFLANISHQFKTPLNSILLLSNLLVVNKENNLSDQQVKFAETINSSGKELLALVEDALDFSEMEHQETKIVKMPVKISEIGIIFKERFQPIANRKKLNFTLDIGNCQALTIKTDLQKLTQVLTHLLANAFKFTNSGQVSLAMIFDPDSQEYCFSVEDTGIGISVEKQTKIFDTFYQVDDDLNRSHNGLGLGLPLVKGLTKKLNGTIKCSSKIDIGSKFTIYLPADLSLVSTDSRERISTDHLHGNKKELIDEWKNMAPLTEKSATIPITKKSFLKNKYFSIFARHGDEFNCLIPQLRKEGAEVFLESEFTFTDDKIELLNKANIALIELENTAPDSIHYLENIINNKNNSTTRIIAYIPESERQYNSRVLKSEISACLTIPVQANKLNFILEAILNEN